MIVDAHLDIAWNALAKGRPFDQPPAPGYLVSRPSLLAADVGLVFATIFCSPPRRAELDDGYVYRTAPEAALMARAQLGYYRSLGLALVRDREELAAHAGAWSTGRLAAVLLMEGADPIEEPGEVGWWAGQGVRVIGPAWGRTRYAGGTGEPGGLTPAGFRLLDAMREAGMILDLSHLADQAVEEALLSWRGPVIASHSNARSLVPGDRQLADGTIAELGRRGGVIGISFFGGHLRPQGGRPSLEDVVRHVTYVARVSGGPEHVGLGTDLDGGFDSSQGPVRRLEELTDLRQMLGDRFSPAQVEGILGGNWLRLLAAALPGAGDGILGERRTDRAHSARHGPEGRP
jgi:membrane dipeptidase